MRKYQQFGNVLTDNIRLNCYYFDSWDNILWSIAKTQIIRTIAKGNNVPFSIEGRVNSAGTHIEDSEVNAQIKYPVAKLFSIKSLMD